MNQKKDQQETRSNGFFDFTPIVTDIMNMLHMAVTFVIKELIKLIVKGIELLLNKAINQGQKKHKRTAILEKSITKKYTTIEKDSIGIDLNTKREVKFSDVPFQRHSLIFGGTGFGKSTAINNIIDYNLQKNHPTFLFDPKGNKSAILEFASLCQYYNKEPVIFSETSFGNAKFNPLKNLNDSQMSTLIENAFEWSDGEARYYRDSTISILTRRVYDEIRESKKQVSLPEIYRQMLIYINDKGDKETAKQISGFFAQLTILMKSPFGKLLEDLDGESLSLMDIIVQKKCVYFGLSVMGYGSISRTLGKLFLGEIQIHTHTLGVTYEDNATGGKNPIMVIIDEAGSLYFKELINLQNKGRSSGIHLVLATQTMADFEGIDPIVLKQIFNNTGCFFTFSQANNEDAETIAKTIGTYKTTKTTNVIDEGDLTDKGSIREVREYYVHPEVIKNLKVGQCVLFTKDPSQNFLLSVRDSNLLPSLVAARNAREMKKREDLLKLEVDLKTEQSPDLIKKKFISFKNMGNDKTKPDRYVNIKSYIKDNPQLHVKTLSNPILKINKSKFEEL